MTEDYRKKRFGNIENFKRLYSTTFSVNRLSAEFNGFKKSQLEAIFDNTKEYTVKYDATERFTRDDLEISGYKKTNANALWVKIRHPNDFFALMIYTIQQPIIKNRLDKRRTPLFWSNHSKTTNDHLWANRLVDQHSSPSC
ncbi:MAG: hypothetical protein OXD01_01625 [Gammaproteobacteria bacterium]|nr:hypothetical protein [Gammaproteobacteria bacterium]